MTTILNQPKIPLLKITRGTQAKPLKITINEIIHMPSMTKPTKMGRKNSKALALKASNL